MTLVDTLASWIPSWPVCILVLWVTFLLYNSCNANLKRNWPSGPFAKPSRSDEKPNSDLQVTEKTSNSLSDPNEKLDSTKTARKFARSQDSGLLDSRSNPLRSAHAIVFYTSLAGTCRTLATELHDHLASKLFKRRIQLINLEEVSDFEDYFLLVPKEKMFYFIVAPSYIDVNQSQTLHALLTYLNDISNDFRVDEKPLKSLSGFHIIGVGDKAAYPDKFCFQTLQMESLLKELGANLVAPTARIDVSFAKYMTDFNVWLNSLSDLLQISSDTTDPKFSLTTGTSNSIDDLEDLGDIMSRLNEVKSKKSSTSQPSEMVPKDSIVFRNLTKQGYSVIGSHSGVKLCRWTKSALRGRGMCYKYSFYGIKSHLCMEVTPSLACANKCTFCWRHGTNPVGTEWKWVADPPETILDGAMNAHYDKMKQLKGLPGLRDERFNEAKTIRHCALSLVGEPIFYPYINEFMSLLHKKRISTFLVTNAQHPEALRNLGVVTQLYVSIDASTKESLKQVDRPLFKDFWERFLQCIDLLGASTQRTVFRLTLVKAFNMDEIRNYAQLVKRGRPCFIEVKGVTYCGKSDASPLTMSNVPYYEEVVTFVNTLMNETNKLLKSQGCQFEYEIATEHAHSNCILLAQTKFKKNGQWYTHIDYNRFFELIENNQSFTCEDYISQTPDFAIYGNGGFSPEDERWYRKKKETI